MAKFRIGMRVRIKYSIGWPELDGKEGVITGLARRSRIDDQLSEWVVAPDMWGSSIAPRPSHDGYGVFAPASDQLEPITDSNDLVSWESMRDLWVPEHLREDA